MDTAPKTFGMAPRPHHRDMIGPYEKRRNTALRGETNGACLVARTSGRTGRGPHLFRALSPTVGSEGRGFGRSLVGSHRLHHPLHTADANLPLLGPRLAAGRSSLRLPLGLGVDAAGRSLERAARIPPWSLLRNTALAEEMAEGLGLPGASRTQDLQIRAGSEPCGTPLRRDQRGGRLSRTSEKTIPASRLPRFRPGLRKFRLHRSLLRAVRGEPRPETNPAGCGNPAAPRFHRTLRMAAHSGKVADP